MPASPSTARVLNDRLALRLLQQKGPLTAGQLKQLTGLSRPTVADLLERLIAADLVEVVGESGEQRRGPNAKVYGIVADLAHLAALDVRTTSVSVVVSDLLGRVLARGSASVGDIAPSGGRGSGDGADRDGGGGGTRDGGPGSADGGRDGARGRARGDNRDEGRAGVGGGRGGGADETGAAVEQTVALVERAAKEAGVDRLHTIGIGIPGLIDPGTGELRASSALPAWHRRLAAALHDRHPHARVHIENEANLAALSEQREGVAVDRDTFVLLWLGHGTGSAVVLDGALRRGASGGAGEIGFLPVPGTGGLPSAGDCEGGFHSLAGAAAVARLARDHGLRPLSGTDAATFGAPAPGTLEPEALDPVDAGAVAALVSRAVADGAYAFLDALADRIAVAACAVAAVLDPGCVVLGGETGHAGGADLAARVELRVRRMSPLATEIRPSALGGGAVLRGALLTARERAQDELFTTG